MQQGSFNTSLDLSHAEQQSSSQIEATERIFRFREALNLANEPDYRIFFWIVASSQPVLALVERAGPQTNPTKIHRGSPLNTLD